MNHSSEFVLDKIFDAPINLVWRIWTEPKLLEHWFGAGVETVIHKYELALGGGWHNEMKWGEKSDFSKMVFQEIGPAKKLVWLQSPADIDGNAGTNSMMPNWPRVVMNTVTFEQEDNKTRVRLTLVPVDASKAETACFEQALPGVHNCFGSGYSIADELLAKLQAQSIGAQLRL